MKRKLVFIGDVDSVNIELINKSHSLIKNKVEYLLVGNIKDLEKYLKIINSKLKINEIFNPINFESYNKDKLNIFNINNVSKEKYKNLINQIELSNHLSNITKIDLVTLPINKSIFKKKISFTGMTEYLAKLNNTNTKMLMHGEKFSIIPLTTHINLKDVNNFITKNQLTKLLNEIFLEIEKKIYNLNFHHIKFLCFNPHCSEENTLGNEDKTINNVIKKFIRIEGQSAADSAFNNIERNSLYISMYHDQALIPFKILNKKGINLTLGLNYKRLSPTHGTARDLKFKNKANNSSFLSCMEC